MELSCIATYDDLRRCDNVLTDGTAEIEFYKFVQMHEEWRMKWQTTTAEAQRLQRELDKALQVQTDLETKLFHARRLLEIESKAKRSAEMEREAVEKKLRQVGELLNTDHQINDETRSKLAFLNMSMRKRKSNKYIDNEKYGNDINSTGSFLSDLSVTQSEDDFLDVNIGHNKPWKKHRPSTDANRSFVDGKQARRSGHHKISDRRRSQRTSNQMEIGDNDKIVATTKVSIPQDDGPIHATSTIQAIPQQIIQRKSGKKSDRQNIIEETEDERASEELSKRPSMKLKEEIPIPSAPILQDICSENKMTLNTQGRQHLFNSKTFVRRDTCSHCLKRIGFGSVAMKCRNCRISVHPDCRIQLAIACVPKSQGTPKLKNGQMGVIADYAPIDGPMVPGLIVHCVNEIETRGLDEEGLYRVSGSEKDIKALKERFLRGKTIPPLGNIDIHVICGCIKNFLRSLREPIIPTALWKDFANAVQNREDEQAARDLFSAINRLPTANRDTLAFIIQHLQRVESCPKTKMSIANLSKIFGPTILGYSSAEPDQHTIYTEVMIQAEVMIHLLKIPTQYWGKFLNYESTDSQKNEAAGRSYFGTPLKNGNATFKRERMFETPPYLKKKSKY